VGRIVHLIWTTITLPFVLLSSAVVLFATAYLCAVGFTVIKRKEQQDAQDEKTKGAAIQVDPEFENEDERRRWLGDLTLADRLKTVDRWFGIQAAEVGALPEPVELWHAKKEQRRREAEAAANRN
jgi:predicted membrane protein